MKTCKLSFLANMKKYPFNLLFILDVCEYPGESGTHPDYATFWACNQEGLKAETKELNCHPHGLFEVLDSNITPYPPQSSCRNNLTTSE